METITFHNTTVKYIIESTFFKIYYWKYIFTNNTI